VADAPDPAPAAGGRRWAVLAFTSTAMFAVYYAFDALNPVGPLLEKELGFTQARIGALDSAYNVAALLVLLAGGVLIDRVGTGRAMAAFAAVAVAGALLVALAPGGYAGMAAGRFFLGLGSEPLIVAATTALGRWFKGRTLSFAMALNISIARLGSVAANNATSWAEGLFASWRKPLLLAAAVAAASVAAGLGYAWLERAAERRRALGSAGATERLVLADLVRFGRAYWWVVGLCVTFYAAVFPFQRFANIFFEQAHGVSPQAAGFLNGLLPTTAMVATPVFGLLADRIGRRALLLAAGSLLLVPAFLVMTVAGVPLGVPVAMIGVSFSLVPAVLWPAVTYVVDEKRLGTAYALMTLLQQVGWAVVSVGLGAANDRFGASAANPGGFAPGMWLLSALGLLGLLFSVLLWRSERHRELETARARS
jgi:MFS family permease